MHATTIRFSEDLWQMIEREAARQRVSTAQFIRDAAMLRVAALAGQRGDPDLVQSVEHLALRAQRRNRASTHTPDDPMRAVHDPARLRALQDANLLDTPPTPEFDRLTRLAAKALGTPTALLSLVDRDRQFFKSQVGLGEPWASRRQTPLSHSFCQYVVAADAPMLVTDAREHPQLRTNHAIEDLEAVSYLGVPVRDGDGQPLGSLCVIDRQPREWTPADLETIEDLAASAAAEIARR